MNRRNSDMKSIDCRPLRQGNLAQRLLAEPRRCLCLFEQWQVLQRS